MREIRTALIQMQCKVGDVEFNRKTALEKCAEAVSQGANFLCLPEMFTTGYDFVKLGPFIHDLGEALDGVTITLLQKFAKENACHIIAPIALYKDLPGILYNSAVIIDDYGDILGVFDKAHLWYHDLLYFRPGDSFPVFKTKHGVVGIMICYDMGFPEVARILTLKGSEIIFCPSAWEINSKIMWDRNIPQRALENTVFIAGANRYGEESPDLFLFGNSKVSNPKGEIIAESFVEGEDIVICDIDLDEVATFRSSIPYLRNRRPELYGYLAD